MAKKTELGAALTIGGLTIVPVAVTSVEIQREEGRVMAFGDTEAVAVIVIGPSGTQVLAVSGDILSLEQLADLYPGIREQLDALSPQP